MRYPEASSLPFNAFALRQHFRSVKPGEPDSGEPGYWIVFRGGSLVLDGASGYASPLLEEFPDGIAKLGEVLTMGTWKGKSVRIQEVSKEDGLPSRFRAEPLLHLFLAEALSDEASTLAGLAQQILSWERTSAACSRCGGTQGRILGTWGKRCAKCGYEHFPHIHPCTIVLVRRGDEMLLIRKAEWPKGYYSLPSGFCDFGESLEECARREVMEETGIRIKNIRYVGSQNWPFPSQLMSGFIAEYAAGEIVVDKAEVEDAAWYRRDALPATFSGKTIAGWMIEGERLRGA
jgi:NAD+ diphosphatase